MIVAKIRFLIDDSTSPFRSRTGVIDVYRDEFRACGPLEDDGAFDRQSVVHSDGAYADQEMHIKSASATGVGDPWLSFHRGISKDNSRRINDRSTHAVIFSATPEKEVLQRILRTVL